MALRCVVGVAPTFQHHCAPHYILTCLQDSPSTSPKYFPVAALLQDGLALRGWRDRGSCFELRASSLLAPDSVTCMYEAETLLLAPGAWAASCLSLFGLSLEGLQVGGWRGW
jgi:hypothetical protein